MFNNDSTETLETSLESLYYLIVELCTESQNLYCVNDEFSFSADNLWISVIFLKSQTEEIKLNWALSHANPSSSSSSSACYSHFISYIKVAICMNFLELWWNLKKWELPERPRSFNAWFMWRTRDVFTGSPESLSMTPEINTYFWE